MDGDEASDTRRGGAKAAAPAAAGLMAGSRKLCAHISAGGFIKVPFLPPPPPSTLRASREAARGGEGIYSTRSFPPLPQLPGVIFRAEIYATLRCVCVYRCSSRLTLPRDPSSFDARLPACRSEFYLYRNIPDPPELELLSISPGFIYPLCWFQV